MSVIFTAAVMLAVMLLVLYALSALLPLTGAVVLSLAGKALGASRKWCGATRLFGLLLALLGLLDSIWWQEGILSKLLCALGLWALLSLPALLRRPSVKRRGKASDSAVRRPAPSAVGKTRVRSSV